MGSRKPKTVVRWCYSWAGPMPSGGRCVGMSQWTTRRTAEYIHREYRRKGFAVGPIVRVEVPGPEEPK